MSVEKCQPIWKAVSLLERRRAEGMSTTNAAVLTSGLAEG
jgi:hypothetical protein